MTDSEKRVISLRWPGILLVAALLFTMLISAASAQSGSGYDLSWSTVDGGGHTWSTGGGYTLGGAIGQPDAGAEHSGGDYSLQGGFWHQACRPVVMDVAISCIGNQVQLDWTHDAANRSYSLHRATSPYKNPVPTNPLAIVSSAQWEWTDAAGTCGDLDINYYYVVRSVCIGAHADSGEIAEFDFGLVSGAP